MSDSEGEAQEPKRNAEEVKEEVQQKLLNEIEITCRDPYQ